MTLRPLALAVVALVGVSGAHATCGYNGVCGSIVFLGKTADRQKAVFLSTTTTPGQYDVSPTSGNYVADTWVMSGPGTHISLSEKVAQWGETHALNYYPSVGGPISSRVYLAGATQNPNGTVYPNDYRPPGAMLPVVAVSQQPQTVVMGPRPLDPPSVTTYNPAMGPVVAPASEVVVATQFVPQPGALVPPPLVQPPQALIQPQPVIQSGNVPLPAQNLPVIVPALDAPVFAEKQNNPGAVAATNVPVEVIVQTTQDPGATDVQVSQGITPATALKGSGGQPVGASKIPAITCNATGDRVDSSRSHPGVCPRPVPDGLYNLWVDTRISKTDDNRNNAEIHSDGKSFATGIDRALQNGLRVGLFVGNESVQGTALNQLILTDTQSTTVGTYASYPLTDRWSLSGGLAFEQKNLSVRLLSLAGEARSDNWTVSAGLSGNYQYGDTWLLPRVWLTHQMQDTKAGRIYGTIAGVSLDLEVPGSHENAATASASLEVGHNIRLKTGVVVTPVVELGMHYAYLGSGPVSPWSGDLRLGVRVQAGPLTEVAISYSQQGVNQEGLNARHLRIAFNHAF